VFFIWLSAKPPALGKEVNSGSEWCLLDAVVYDSNLAELQEEWQMHPKKVKRSCTSVVSSLLHKSHPITNSDVVRVRTTRPTRHTCFTKTIFLSIVVD
jgi:hypothetical protein